jgi:hypothetical protein
MSALKITDREEVLRLVLKEAFEPRFDALLKRAESLLTKHLAKEHPRFVELFADTASRAYLAMSVNTRPYLKNKDNSLACMCSPKYETYDEQPDCKYPNTERYRHFAMSPTVPCSLATFVVEDAKLLAAYSQAWVDYSAAWTKLYAVLCSYSQREKLIADFPEFEAYLPELLVKAKLPSVIVKDVRRDLKKLGVPAVVAK